MTPSLSETAQSALARGNKIEAIKIVRAETGADLKTAKDTVDAFLNANPDIERQMELNRVSVGIGPFLAVFAAIAGGSLWFIWGR